MVNKQKEEVARSLKKKNRYGHKQAGDCREKT